MTINPSIFKAYDIRGIYPQDINQENIQMLIQQVVSSVVQQSLNNAVQVAVEQLVKSLPHAGFERFLFDSGWQKEE